MTQITDDMLTPWSPGDVKPVHVGDYEVRGSRLQGSKRRHFDGMHWRAGWFNDLVSIFGTRPDHEWRGLKEKAE